MKQYKHRLVIAALAGGIYSTMRAIGLDPETAPMLAHLQDKEGKPVVCASRIEWT